MSEAEVQLTPAEIAANYVNRTGRHIYLTGKAGTGKTTFLRNIIKLTHKKAVIVAPTGIAAINAGGVTIHSMFQLPFGTFLPRAFEQELPGLHYNTPRTLAKHLHMNTVKRRILQDIELLIIDEVSMLRADLLDAIDTALRQIRRRYQESFGGVQVLFIGDLHQLPPVVKPNEWQAMSTFYKSIYFFDAQVLQQDPPVYIELEKIYRQSDEQFISLLNNLRNNVVTPADMDLLSSYYRNDFKPDVNDRYITLTTHNNKADALNREMLRQLPQKAAIYKARLKGDFPENSWPADQELELKTGAQVMFTKNDPTGEQRFFNGKLGEITALGDDFIQVLSDGAHITVTPYTWQNMLYATDKVTNEITEEVAGTFEQYPLKLAWAITVHKSQGLTFDKAIIDIGDAFAPGQVYVALSRLRSLKGLVLTSRLQGNSIRIDQHISYFSRNKLSPDTLLERIGQDSAVFMHRYVLSSFNFEDLERGIYEHTTTYVKDEKRSAKQRHKDWAVELHKLISELKVHADKFLGQLNKLFASGDLHDVLKRVQAAVAYFSPLLQQCSFKVFEQVELVKTEKQHTEYLKELAGMELLFFEQHKRLLKAEAYLGATITNTDLSREDLQRKLDHAGRREKLTEIYQDADHHPEEEFTDKMRRKKKKKAPAVPKEDTKEVTLKLFEQGHSIAEIAQLRSMVSATIEGHLAHFIAKRELEAERVLSKEKLAAVAKAVTDTKKTSLQELRKHLGSNYSFGEIKIGLAALFTEA